MGCRPADVCRRCQGRGEPRFLGQGAERHRAALPLARRRLGGSRAVGQDGPTHQPVEQLIALRAIPGLITLRPADANEVVAAWRVIIGLAHQPACLVLSRQPLPTLDRTRYASADGVGRGAYVLADAKGGRPAVILIATGSEVALC